MWAPWSSRTALPRCGTVWKWPRCRDAGSTWGTQWGRPGPCAVHGLTGTLVPIWAGFPLFAKNCPLPKKGTIILGTTASDILYLFSHQYYAVNGLQMFFFRCEFFFGSGSRTGSGRWEPFSVNSHDLWCGVACPQDIECWNRLQAFCLVD